MGLLFKERVSGDFNFNESSFYTLLLVLIKFSKQFQIMLKK